MKTHARRDGDRSMCSDHACPSAARCLRHEAPPAHHQVYADQGRKPGAERCSAFISLAEADG